MLSIELEVKQKPSGKEILKAAKRQVSKANKRLARELENELRSGAAQVPFDRGDLRSGFYVEPEADGVQIYNREQHAGPVNYGTTITNSRNKPNTNRYFLQRYLDRSLSKLLDKVWNK